MVKRRKILRVNANPKVINWALKSSGWSVEELSNKLQVNEDIIKGWISGEITPTLKQLEDTANYIKRPMAVFFLPEPPEEKPLPKDYRTLPDRTDKFDKKTHLALRRALRLQKISKELLNNLGKSIKPNVNFLKMSEDPKKVGIEERASFGITNELQRKWKNPYQAFNEIRTIMEEKNIFVFQMPMPLEDARGFSLIEDMPAVIVVNSSDVIEARIFTLIHEYGHIILNKSGIDIPQIAFLNPNIDRVEVWCNEFASEFLLPSENIKKEFNEYRQTLLDNITISRLSRRYKVSKSMIVYKMRKLDFISIQQYDHFRERLASMKKDEKSGGFGLKQDKKCLQEKGKKFVSLVTDNVDRGNINYNDAIDFLSIRLKNVDKVLSKASQ